MARTTETEVLDQQFRRAVSLLSFMDCFRGIAWLTSAVVPLLFLIRCFKAAGKAPAAHWGHNEVNDRRHFDIDIYFEELQ